MGAQVKQKAGLFLQQLKLMKKHQERTYNILVGQELDQQVCRVQSVDIHFDETAPNRISALQRMLLFPEQEMAEEPQIVEPRQFRKQDNCVIQLDSSLSNQSCSCCLNYQYLLNAYPNDFDFEAHQQVELTLYVLYQSFDISFLGLSGVVEIAYRQNGKDEVTQAAGQGPIHFAKNSSPLHLRLAPGTRLNKIVVNGLYHNFLWTTPNPL